MRIRFTNRKTGEAMTIAGAPESAVPFFAVQLGVYGVQVNAIGPDVPVCQCRYSGGQYLIHPDCDIHKPVPTPAQRKPEMTPFAEALFRAAVEQLARDVGKLNPHNNPYLDGRS